MTLNRWIHIESMQSGAVKYHLSLSAQSVTNFVQLVFTALCVSLGRPVGPVSVERRGLTGTQT